MYRAHEICVSNTAVFRILEVISEHHRVNKIISETREAKHVCGETIHGA
jgi:hypothetical protein